MSTISIQKKKKWQLLQHNFDVQCFRNIFYFCVFQINIIETLHSCIGTIVLLLCLGIKNTIRLIIGRLGQQ